MMRVTGFAWAIKGISGQAGMAGEGQNGAVVTLVGMAQRAAVWVLRSGLGVCMMVGQLEAMARERISP